MSEIHHAPHAKRFAVGVADECAIGSYVRFEDYETLRKQYDHTYAVTLAKLAAAEARAVRCEGERDVARDALENIRSDIARHARPDDPAMVFVSIDIAARDALEALDA